MDLDLVLAKLDWIERQQADRHVENVARLGRIESEVRTTNGRVTRLEEQTKTLFSARDEDRSAHDDEDTRRADDDVVRVGRLKWYLGCAGGGFGAAFWLMHLLGKV